MRMSSFLSGMTLASRLVVSLAMNSDMSQGLISAAFKLHCKLTDFGALQLPSGDIALGGSRPWQAPEITREAAFKVQDAKRTDVYGQFRESAIVVSLRTAC